MFKTERSVLSFIFGAFLVLLRGQFTHASYSIRVHSGKSECYKLRIPGEFEQHITGSFELLDDLVVDSHPVTFRIIDVEAEEDQEDLYRSDLGQSEGVFYVVTTGTIQLCVSNGVLKGEKPDGKERLFGFNIRVRPPERYAADDVNGPDNEKTAKIMERTGEMMDRIAIVADHQTFMKERDFLHMSLSNRTLNTLLRWTMLEAIILILISVLQVLYLRKFFERKRYL